MWVFCCGMQRSGSTLQYQIAAHLVEERHLGQRVGWCKPEDFGGLRSEHAGEAGWKVFKTHVCTAEMVSVFDEGDAAGIYVYRDLRDVFVSAIKKYRTTFRALWSSGYLEVLLMNHEGWTRLPNMLVSRYERMIVDLPEEVHRIATHMQIETNRRQCEQVAVQYTLEQQVRRIQRAVESGNLRSGFLNSRYDPHSMLHSDHFGAGGRPDEVSTLSMMQVALIESRAAAWLLEHGYPLRSHALRRSLASLDDRLRRSLQ